jgi:hypothetical protein
MPLLAARGRLHFAAAGVHAGQADRRQRHRHGEFFAEQLVSRSSVDMSRSTRWRGDVGQVGDVALQRVFGGAAVDVVEQERRQAALAAAR